MREAHENEKQKHFFSIILDDLIFTSFLAIALLAWHKILVETYFLS